MNYKVVHTSNQYQVFEIATEQVIKTFNLYQPARKLSDFLNRGGGFDGQTPPFFVKNWKTINTA